jgi:hypothetical protein
MSTVDVVSWAPARLVRRSPASSAWPGCGVGRSPAGTTSRYFRTRDALMRGVLERARTLHFGDLERARQAAARARANATVGLATIVHNALTTHRLTDLVVVATGCGSNHNKIGANGGT